MRFKDKALPYAAMGWHVFPLRPGTNKNFSRDEEPGLPHGGFYWGTTNEAKIAEWDARWPDANIGLRTGTISGVVCLDLDFGKEYSNTREALDRLASKGFVFPPSNCVARTPSGGEHWYYRAVGPLRPSVSRLGAEFFKGRITPDGKPAKSSIDIRADDSLAFLPPTIVEGKGEYIWVRPPFGQRLLPLPRWVMDQLKEAAPEVRRPYVAPSSSLDLERLTWRLKVVAGEGEGARNQTLFRMVAQAADQGFSQAIIEHEFLEAATAAGLDRRGASATIKSALAERNRRASKERS